MDADNKETETKEESTLNENLSWAGKLFFTTMAAKLAHDTFVKLPFNIKGTPEQIKAIASAIYASKAYQDEIKKPGATVQSVYKKMNLQNLTRERFYQLTGHKMPV